jgi:hypothetical protein
VALWRALSQERGALALRAPEGLDSPTTGAFVASGGPEPASDHIDGDRQDVLAVCSDRACNASSAARPEQSRYSIVIPTAWCMTVGTLSPHNSADNARASCTRMYKRCQSTSEATTGELPRREDAESGTLPVTALRASEVMRPERADTSQIATWSTFARSSGIAGAQDAF